MVAFLILGSAGLLLVVGSLLFGDLFEGVFDFLDIDVGSGLFSAPVIGAFLTALGFGGWLTLRSSSAGSIVALAVGLGAGVAFGAFAWWITRALMNMRTDAPVRVKDLVGKKATVVSTIPQDGLGEISLVHLGQRMKLYARATTAVTVGTEVMVIEATSASSVLVEPAITFWASGGRS